MRRGRYDCADGWCGAEDCTRCHPTAPTDEEQARRDAEDEARAEAEIARRESRDYGPLWRSWP